MIPARTEWCLPIAVLETVPEVGGGLQLWSDIPSAAPPFGRLFASRCWQSAAAHDMVRSRSAAHLGDIQ